MTEERELTREERERLVSIALPYWAPGDAVMRVTLRDLEALIRELGDWRARAERMARLL